ncbi:MAG: ABC transporter ATP-binding protein [Crocinitomicaceae bacterium]
MKGLKEIYRYTFVYRWRANLTIIFNFLFVIFNLVSLVLFIPFLNLVFKQEMPLTEPIAPKNEGFIKYCSDYYNYFMETFLYHNGKEQALLFICISVLIAFFLKNVFRYLAIYHQSDLRMSVVRDIRNKLFAKSLRLPMSFHTEEKKGDLMSRMNNDVNEMEVAVVSVLQLIYRDPFDVLLSISALLYWSPKLTLISFLVLPLSAFVISRIGKSLKRTARAGQDQMGSVFSIIEETLGGIKIIKAFNAINFVQNKFEQANLKHQKLITKTFRKKDLSSPLNEFLGAFVMLVIVFFGGSIVLANDGTSGLTGPQFIGFVLVFSQLLRPIQSIANNIALLNKAKVSLDRINQILDTDEKILDPENPIPFNPISEGVSYKNVVFAYGDKSVLKEINFNVPKGKTIALVGESGSGKSTIADLLPRFYDIQSGEITIDGNNIKSYKVEDLRKHIGIVSQESILFNDSIRNNIAFGIPEASLESIMEAAKVANAHDFIEQQEMGYETIIGERGNKLSGGQKQRINIARAVLTNPDVLILDEATSALDTESERLVQDALNKLMANRTSIVIAHRLSTIQHADEIIVLSKGEIIERGKHADLLAQKGAYYRLCSLQGFVQ